MTIDGCEVNPQGRSLEQLRSKCAAQGELSPLASQRKQNLSRRQNCTGPPWLTRNSAACYHSLIANAKWNGHRFHPRFPVVRSTYWQRQSLVAVALVIRA